MKAKFITLWNKKTGRKFYLNVNYIISISPDDSGDFAHIALPDFENIQVTETAEEILCKIRGR